MPPTILNIDDYDPKRYTKTRALRAAGYTVLEASTGTEGLRLALQSAPDLVLLDVHLPDISGHEVCRQLKIHEATRTVMVLQMSATFVSADDRVHGLQSGADAYLTEPVQSDELIATVRALLRLGEAERELRESLGREQAARRDAEAAAAAKDHFLAVLSHELRTPVNAILGWAHMLRQGLLRGEAVDHAIQVIERNAVQQARLVSDIVDATRISTHKLQMSREPVALADVVRQASEGVRPTADARGQDFVVDIESDPYVLGDAGRLEQLVANLLSNAVKFTPAHGRISLRLRDRPGMAELVVADSGVGIPPGALARIFEPFWQVAPATTRKEGGLGLGLTIARHIAEEHGGTIVAESQGENRGSRFVVAIPHMPAPVTDAAPGLRP